MFNLAPIRRWLENGPQEIKSFVYTFTLNFEPEGCFILCVSGGTRRKDLFACEGNQNQLYCQENDAKTDSYILRRDIWFWECSNLVRKVRSNLEWHYSWFSSSSDQSLYVPITIRPRTDLHLCSCLTPLKNQRNCFKSVVQIFCRPFFKLVFHLPCSNYDMRWAQFLRRFRSKSSLKMWLILSFCECEAINGHPFVCRSKLDPSLINSSTPPKVPIIGFLHYNAATFTATTSLWVVWIIFLINLSPDRWHHVISCLSAVCD